MQYGHSFKWGASCAVCASCASMTKMIMTLRKDSRIPEPMELLNQHDQQGKFPHPSTSQLNQPNPRGQPIKYIIYCKSSRSHLLRKKKRSPAMYYAINVRHVLRVLLNPCVHPEASCSPLPTM